ncbi:MAG: ATP-dependent DNA helicase, partial [Alphaproteobacteria bacterium]|nr:ATP-dependent DNA helicase [Alphaproteobacteria bacterium]
MTDTAAARVLLPDAPVLVAGSRVAAWLSADGEIETVSTRVAAERARGTRPILCHRPAAWARLGGEPFAALDVLELFAFVRPARFCLPTPRGLAEALDMRRPEGMEAEAAALMDVVRLLLGELVLATHRDDAAMLADARAIA